MSVKTTKSFIFVLLLFALFGLIANSVVNGHFHHLDTGRVIFHAHPFEGDAAGKPVHPSHDHSNSQLLFFDLFTAFVFILTYFLLVLSELIRLDIFFIPAIFFTPVLFTTSLQRRGPPACL